MDKLFNEKLISELSAQTGVGKVVTAMCVARGYRDKAAITAFLHPEISALTSPEKFKGMFDAAELIKKHSLDGRILIFGDYDCDGIGAAAMLYLALKDHGADVQVYIPTRVEDGYGLSVQALERATANFSPTLLITVDCGIGSSEEIAFAVSKGLDTIVTDHHEPSEVIPEGIVIDPKLDKSLPELCGAGVTFTLLRALYGDDYAMNYIDIAAISTIADLVPLVGDNRIIAAFGLKKMCYGEKRPGVQALLEVSGHKSSKLTASDIAFRLAPRLNASGRLSSAFKSFRLLTETDAKTLYELARDLEEENKRRQQLCNDTFRDAREMLREYDLTHHRIIVLHNSNWEAGVVGIAAAKIAEEFRRPTVLFVDKDDCYKGSCRSIAGINIHDVLSAASDTLIQFGGHAMAAGLSIRPENLQKFTAVADAYIKSVYSESLFLPVYESDAELTAKEITPELVKEIEMLEPCGMGNPKPRFKTLFTALPFNRIKSLPHIKAKLSECAELVAFNEFDKIRLLRSPMQKEIFYSLELDNFRGNVAVRALFKGFRITEIKPSDEMVFSCYAEKFVPVNAAERLPSVDSGYDEMFGRLLICFSLSTFKRLSEQYPDYRRILTEPDMPNPYNAILLSPSVYADLSYYSVIEVYDSPADSYIDFLKNSFSAEIVRIGNTSDIPKGSIDVDRKALVKLFSYVKASAEDKTFEGVEDIYFKLCVRGYDKDYYSFLTAWYVLREIGVVYIDKENVVRLSKEKKDLGKSKILKIAEQRI